MRALTLIWVASTACTSSPVITLTPSASTRAYLVAELDPSERLTRLTAFDVAALARLEIERTDESLIRVLEFSLPIDALTVTVGEGEVPVLGVSASSDEAWPLDHPSKASELRGLAEQFSEVPELDRWLATFRVPRPPCPPAPRFERIGADIVDGSASMVLALGDHALVAFYGPSPARTSSLLRIDLGTREVEDLTEQGGLASVATAPGYVRGFVDDGQAWILWPTGTTTASHVMVPVSPSGTVGTAMPVTMDPEIDSFAFDQLASGRFGGQRTLVALTAYGSHLLSFDEATRHWSVVEGPIDMGPCTQRALRFVLEVDGPGRGLVGLRSGSIVRFDLTRPPGQRILRTSNLIEGGPHCVNVRTKTDAGLDVLVSGIPGAVIPQVIMNWRLPGEEEWERATRSNLLANGIAPVSDGFVVAGDNDTVVHYEHSARRRALAPRECSTNPVARSSVYHLVRAGPATIIMGGTRGAGFLDFAAQ